MSQTSNPIPEQIGLDPDVRENLAIIGSPITFMEKTSRGFHRRAPHLTYLAERCVAKIKDGRPMDAVPGDQQFLACYIPVRHGKSFFTCRYFLPWLMGMFPGIQVLFVTYSDERAKRWGAQVRDMMREWAPVLFGCTVSGTDDSASHWSLSNGSTMRCLGMGGAITGEGAHIIVIDDTLKEPADADSPTIKEGQESWYYETLRNRLEPGGLMLCCVARWRADDLPGRVCQPAGEVSDEDEAPDDWEILRFAALAEAPTPQPPPPPEEIPDPPEGWAEDAGQWVERWKAEWIDEWCDRFRAEWRDELGRAEGEALWPDRWPAKRLRRIRATYQRSGQTHAWEALYQQNPTPKEGGSFRVDAWRRIGMAPQELATTVRFWDLSASKRKGDFTVGVKMGLGFNNEVYILHVARDRLDPAGVQNLVKTMAFNDGFETIIGMEEETGGAAGKANSATFAALLLGYIFEPERVSGNKEVRAAGYAAHQGNGLVWLVDDGTWDVNAFVAEHTVFPGGRNDDQVDAASGAFRMVALGGFGPASATQVAFPEPDSTRVARHARGEDGPRRLWHRDQETEPDDSGEGLEPFDELDAELDALWSRLMAR